MQASKSASKYVVQETGKRPRPGGRVSVWFLTWMLVALAGTSHATTDAADRPAQATAQRPNVVVIMTDNHGAWTLGCYGNRDIRTPHIDRLAAEGTLFDRAFACNPVCSPTRASFLTGLMPSQHGVHCFLGAGRLQVGPDARNTLGEFTSLPEILRDAGYACGLVGKWHLGDNLHPQEGLNDYWITMPHGGTTTFYDAPIIAEGKVRKEPEYLTDFWTRHAVTFIERQAKGDRPFFLFLSYNGPYALGRLLLREGRNRHAAYYSDKRIESFPRQPAHPWQYNNRDFINNPVSIRRVATEVSGVDDGVGSVLEALKQHGLDENTLVVLLADQGWEGGHGGFFGMGDHTRPVTARDRMMRIPMIWRQPGRVAAGRRSNKLVANYDCLPSILSHLGLGDRMPQRPRSPGEDFGGELSSDSQPPDQAASDAPRKRAVFYEFEGLRCIRTDRWKYVHRFPNGPHELYDLAADPEEWNNLAESRPHRDRREQLKQRLDAFYARYAEPRYDLWKGGKSQTRIFVPITDRHGQDKVWPVATDKRFTPATIRVPDGYEVELAAGPPLVTHPTLACFDDRGRLFVCNNAGVNLAAKQLEEQLPNSIRMLEDLDNDGRFDRSTVFADRMTYPMGGAWFQGALYVASPPYIWRLEDTDNDGIADRRDIVVKQFGYTGNAASIHGCFLGPDGRLYWCDGYHGHEFRDQQGKLASRREGSYLFSCQPDGSDVRIHCGGGMDNPVEVDFTDEGELLGTVNIMYTRPRFDCFVHWLHGGAYPHRERVLDELKVTGPLLGPVHRFGHVAVSGTCRYRSGVLDHRWRDNFFATFFNSGKVVRLETARAGSTFEVRQREFLSSPSRDFHPTDVLEDADGSLLVIDTGGWFYRGCPTSQLSKPEVLGGIYRVRRKGMTTVPDPWGRRIAWSKLTAGQLIGRLNDTRHVVRQRAIREAARRGAAMVPVLSTALDRRDIRYRLGALWALTQIIGQSDQAGEPDAGRKAARAAIRRALDDRDPRVRLAACRSVATYPDPAATSKLLKRLNTDQPAVRREAATALGRIGTAQAVPALLAGLDAADRSEEHARVYALIEINDAPALRNGLSAKSPRVRRAALTALDQMDSGKLQPVAVAAMLDSDDASLRAEAARVLARRAEQDGWSAAFAEQLEVWLTHATKLPTRQDTLEALTARFASNADVAAVLGRGLGDHRLAEAERNVLWNALGAASDLPMHPSWVGPLERELSSKDSARVARAVRATASIKSDRLHPLLDKIAANQQAPTILRVAALRARQRSSRRLDDQAFGLLLDLLQDPRHAGHAAQAAQLLGTAQLTRPQLLRLAPRLAEAGSIELGLLLRPFGGSRDVEVGKAFLAAAERSAVLPSTPANQLSDVVKRYPAELRDRANALLEKVRAREEAKIARLDHLLPLVDGANPEAGKQLFFGQKAKCAQCHRIGKQGLAVGPDLATIGQNRSAADLLESIVFPSASIVRDYQAYVVQTTDGRILTGLITRESNHELEVQPAAGKPTRLTRDQIERVQPSPVSIMPSGLDDALSEAEFADLVAYLLTLRSQTER